MSRSCHSKSLLRTTPHRDPGGAAVKAQLALSVARGVGRSQAGQLRGGHGVVLVPDEVVLVAEGPGRAVEVPAFGVALGRLDHGLDPVHLVRVVGEGQRGPGGRQRAVGHAEGAHVSASGAGRNRRASEDESGHLGLEAQVPARDVSVERIGLDARGRIQVSGASGIERPDVRIGEDLVPAVVVGPAARVDVGRVRGGRGPEGLVGAVVAAPGAVVLDGGARAVVGDEGPAAVPTHVVGHGHARGRGLDRRAVDVEEVVLHHAVGRHVHGVGAQVVERAVIDGHRAPAHGQDAGFLVRAHHAVEAWITRGIKGQAVHRDGHVQVQVPQGPVIARVLDVVLPVEQGPRGREQGHVLVARQAGNDARAGVKIGGRGRAAAGQRVRRSRVDAVLHQGVGAPGIAGRGPVDACAVLDEVDGGAVGHDEIVGVADGREILQETDGPARGEGLGRAGVAGLQVVEGGRVIGCSAGGKAEIAVADNVVRQADVRGSAVGGAGISQEELLR